jgi:hypothetical protein
MLEKTAVFHEAKARAIRDAIKALCAPLELESATPRAAARPGYGTRRRQRARRKASADLLAAFDTSTAREAPPGKERAVAPLIRHGYLKKKGDGYVRTLKPFFVDET